MNGPLRVVRAERDPRGTPGAVLEAVRVELLGGFRVSVGPRAVGEDGWRLRKARGLVALLVLEPGRRMHRERLMDLLWPELDAGAAANNLRYALHVARRTLDPDPAAASCYLRFEGELLALCPGGMLWVDVEAFEEAAANARRLGELAAYRVATELYAGELLPRDRYEEWAEDRREGLWRDHLALLVELARLHEERGEPEPAAEALRRVVAGERTHEGAHAGLMRLHALTDRRDEALLQYDRLREALSRELGTAPNADSRRLYEEISAGRLPQAHTMREEKRQRPGLRHNLPASRTSFVGREHELVEVRRLLSMTRLLTLTGAGARVRPGSPWRWRETSWRLTPTACGSWNWRGFRRRRWWRRHSPGLWGCVSSPDVRSPARWWRRCESRRCSWWWTTVSISWTRRLGWWRCCWTSAPIFESWRPAGRFWASQAS